MASAHKTDNEGPALYWLEKKTNATKVPLRLTNSKE